LAQKIYDNYITRLTNEIPGFGVVFNSTITTNQVSRLKNQLDGKVFSFNITKDIHDNLETFIKDNNFKTKDDIEKIKKKRFFIHFKPFVDLDRNYRKKEEYFAIPRNDMVAIEIQIKHNVLPLVSKKEVLDLKITIRHELVHMFDFSRIEKHSTINKETNKEKITSIVKKPTAAKSVEYFKTHHEQNVLIQSIVSDIMNDKRSRTYYKKLTNSQELLQKFGEKFSPGVAKSGINTEENIKNWNRFVSEFMSKVRDANQKIKINFRNKGISYTEVDLIPEKFGFLTKLKGSTE